MPKEKVACIAVCALTHFCKKFPDSSLKHIHLVDIQSDIISLYQGQLDNKQFRADADYADWNSWFTSRRHRTSERDAGRDRHQRNMVTNSTSNVQDVTPPTETHMRGEATPVTPGGAPTATAAYQGQVLPPLSQRTDVDREPRHGQTPNVEKNSLPVDTKPTPRAYCKLEGDLWVYAWKADITNMKVDVVVNTTNERLSNDAGRLH